MSPFLRAAASGRHGERPPGREGRGTVNR